MLYFSRWKTVLIWAIVALGVIVALPNLYPQSWLNAMPDWMPKRTMTLGLDLRDIEADARRGVTTLPVIFGFRKAKRFILLLIILSATAFLIPEFSGKIPVLLSLALTAIAVLYLEASSSYWAYFFLLDGIMILHALFLLV